MKAFEQHYNRRPGRTRSCEFLFYSVATENVSSNQSGGRVKTRDCQGYTESTRNTRNRLKMRGERRRGSSVLVTGVGGACFPARFQLSHEMKQPPEISLCSHRVPRKTSMHGIFNNSRTWNANRIFHNYSCEHDSFVIFYRTLFLSSRVRI